MTRESAIAFLTEILDSLTWKKALLISALGAILLLMLVAFENRQVIFNTTVKNQPFETIISKWVVSDQTKKSLADITKKQDIIGGFMITEIDLKKNRRDIKYWYLDSDVTTQKVSDIVETLLPQPFFDSDPKNNTQMISVLGNQFVCTKIEDTVFTRFIPDIVKTYPHICRLAVPPFAGEFAGMITIFLTRPPEAYEIESLRIELTRISIDLYLRDIERRSN